MPRVRKRQQEPKSCGAATLLVTLHELLGVPAQTTNAEEDAIYKVVRFDGFGPQKLGKDETLPSSVYDYATGKGLKAAIIESPNTSKTLLQAFPGAAGMYQLYRAALGSRKLENRDVQDSDFNDNGRVFFVVKFAASDLTHYVLGRKDGGQIYIMNPDPGSDEPMPLLKVGDSLATNNQGTLIFNSGTAATENDADVRRYIFTGIAVRVWK